MAKTLKTAKTLSLWKTCKMCQRVEWVSHSKIVSVASLNISHFNFNFRKLSFQSINHNSNWISAIFQIVNFLLLETFPWMKYWRNFHLFTRFFTQDKLSWQIENASVNGMLWFLPAPVSDVLRRSNFCNNFSW